MFKKTLVTLLFFVGTLFHYNLTADASSAPTGQPPSSYELTFNTHLPNPIEITTPTLPSYDTAVLDPLHAAQKAEADAAAKAATDAAQAAATEAANEVQQQATVVSITVSDGNDYDWGNCTWYVASRRSVPSDWGNANQWAYRAGLAGWTVSTNPRIGAIAQTSAGYFGHVAYVEAIGNGTVTVSEMNVMGLDVVDTQTYPVGQFLYLY